jgi:hypothetical protein
LIILEEKARKKQNIPQRLYPGHFWFSFSPSPAFLGNCENEKKHRIDGCFKTPSMAYTHGEMLFRAPSLSLIVTLSPELTYRGNSNSWFLRWRRHREQATALRWLWPRRQLSFCG